MANDLAAMKARIALELARSDLTAQIADAITSAIGAYQGERFRFSETIPNAPPTLSTVAGQWAYAAAANANIPTLLKIDYVLLNIGNSVQALDRETPENIKLYNQQSTMAGQPMWYAYEGNQLIISPVPDGIYTLTLGAFLAVAAPASDGETNNPWMTTAERLIRSRAKYELAVHVLRNPTMAAAMSPEPGSGGAAYREWKTLKGASNRVIGTGRVRAMQF
jgi:hypothetical protein